MMVILFHNIYLKLKIYNIIVLLYLCISRMISLLIRGLLIISTYHFVLLAVMMIHIHAVASDVLHNCSRRLATIKQ